METQEIFRETNARDNFDLMAWLIQQIAIHESQIPRERVHKTLEYTVVGGP